MGKFIHSETIVKKVNEIEPKQVEEPKQEKKVIVADEYDTVDKAKSVIRERLQELDNRIKSVNASIQPFHKILNLIDDGKITEDKSLFYRLGQTYTLIAKMCQRNKKYNKVGKDFRCGEFLCYSYFSLTYNTITVTDSKSIAKYVKENLDKFIIKNVINIAIPSSFIYQVDGKWIYHRVVDTPYDTYSSNRAYYLSEIMKPEFVDIYEDVNKATISYQLIHTLDDTKIRKARQAGENIPEDITEDSSLYINGNKDDYTDYTWIDLVITYMQVAPFGDLEIKDGKLQFKEKEKKKAEVKPQITDNKPSIPTIEEMKAKIITMCTDFDKKYKLEKSKFGTTMDIIHDIDNRVVTAPNQSYKRMTKILEYLKITLKRNKKLYAEWYCTYKNIEIAIDIYEGLNNAVFRFDDEVSAIDRVKTHFKEWYTLGGLLNIPSNTNFVVLYDNRYYYADIAGYRDAKSKGVEFFFTFDVKRILDFGKVKTHNCFAFPRDLDLVNKKFKEINDYVFTDDCSFNEGITPDTPLADIYNFDVLDASKDYELAILCAIYAKYNRSYTSTGGGEVIEPPTESIIHTVNVTDKEVTLYLPKDTNNKEGIKEDEEEVKEKGTHASPREHERRGHNRHLSNGKVVSVRGTTVNKGKNKTTRYKIK